MESGDTLHLATCSIHMRFDPKDLDHALRLLLSVRENIQAKRDCHACEVGTEVREAGLVRYREEWISGKAFIRHVRSAEFQRVLFALDLCSEEPRIVLGNLSGLTGISHLLKLREKTWLPFPADGTLMAKQEFPGAADERVDISIVCVTCGSKSEIRVPRSRGVPTGTYRWECLECQRNGAGKPTGRKPV